jgi:hypothetical protein
MLLSTCLRECSLRPSPEASQPAQAQFLGPCSRSTHLKMIQNTESESSDNGGLCTYPPSVAMGHPLNHRVPTHIDTRSVRSLPGTLHFVCMDSLTPSVSRCLSCQPRARFRFPTAFPVCFSLPWILSVVGSSSNSRLEKPALVVFCWPHVEVLQHPREFQAHSFLLGIVCEDIQEWIRTHRDEEYANRDR